MKKKILSIALIAMSLVSFTGVAQNVASSQSVSTEKVEKVKKDGRKDDRKDKDGKKADRKNKGEKKNPFAGMNLTEAQQQQLQQLNESRRAAREQQKMAKKETKQRNDSIKKAERIADKKAYLEQVKSIIGPDQYVVFLENAYVFNNGGQQKGMKAHHGQQMKQGKHKGQKDGKRDMAQKNHGKGSRTQNEQRSNS